MDLRDLRLDDILRYQRPFRQLVEASMIGLGAILAVHLFWLVLDPAGSVVRNELDVQFPPMVGASEPLARLDVDRTRLMQLNPFAGSEAEVIPDAPETTLNLSLSGLLMSSNAEGGSAIIRTANGANISFSPGETIMPGVTLERILSDRVILSRNGTQEALMLGGRGEGLSVIGDGSQVTDLDGSDTAGAADEPATISGRVSDPLAFAAAISLTPVDRNGQSVGLRVGLKGAPEMMRSAGLAPGDVITAINGTPTSTESLNLLLANLSRGDTVTLDVDRSGTRQSINLLVGD